jgi:hypothetical protein
MLLSLVVIFTQSIQLSKIVERFTSLPSRPEAAQAFLLKVQAPLTQNLNLKQLRIPIESEWWS